MQKTTTDIAANGCNGGEEFFQTHVRAKRDLCALNYSASALIRRPTLYPAELWAQIRANHYKNSLGSCPQNVSSKRSGVYLGVLDSSRTGRLSQHSRRLKPAHSGGLTGIKIWSRDDGL